ncbi:MAG: hypothetical protein K2L74_00015 [Muribaculaceae bacterium]|nr:hypothetical protein [Muribaculaceae bacterium]MDE6540377.1 hypothetical protein [Muribaculaceae bacterium]
MENLSETLKQQAVDLGLCRPWTEAWGDCDQQELIDKFVKGIDFCLERNWPTSDFIKSNFDRALLNANLIFVDEHLQLDNAPSGIYILNGQCSGSIRFAPWTAATVYVRHTSNVRVVAGDFAKVFVRLYDEAEAEAKAEESAVIKVYDRK